MVVIVEVVEQHKAFGPDLLESWNPVTRDLAVSTQGAEFECLQLFPRPWKSVKAKVLCRELWFALSSKPSWTQYCDLHVANVCFRVPECSQNMVIPTDLRLEIDVSETWCRKWKKELIVVTDSGSYATSYVHADNISRSYQQTILTWHYTT
jgi:hypothetical protein